MAINLLPQGEKRALRQEKTWRKVFIILSFVLLFLIILTLLMFFVRIYIDSETALLQEELSGERQKIDDITFREFRETTSKTNQSLTRLNGFRGKEILLSPIFKKLTEILPASIYFTQFSYEKEESINGDIYGIIRVTGHADDRNTLYYLRGLLKDEDLFENVEFTRSSWVTPYDLEFSFSFEIQ